MFPSTHTHTLHISESIATTEDATRAATDSLLTDSGNLLIGHG